MQYKNQKAFTLVEVLVGTAIFLVIGVASYGAFANLFKLAAASQGRIIATELANEQFEIIRNMPYSNIGTVTGLPKGSLPASKTVNRGGVDYLVGYTIRDVDLSFDGTIGSTTMNDLAPADNKFVEVSVSCPGCANFPPIIVSGQVAPKNLENSSSNGALFVAAIDANGNPVQGASVHISYATTSPIIIDDTTNNDGVLQVVNAPPAVKAYNIIVTKDGYSTDETHAVSGGNPNPTKLPATVAKQQLTQVSFSIDKLSSLNIKSVTPTCSLIPNFDFNMVGAKQIGTNLPKYSQSLSTNGSGSLNLSSMEWDSYSITPTDSSYDLVGINPTNPISLSPNSTQSLQLVVLPKNGNSIMVTVKDNATNLPISNATVELSGGSYDQIKYTGQGYLSQTDWTGGSGQNDFLDLTRYYNSDGNVDTSTSSGNVVLKSFVSGYPASGYLESSTFDTGTSSNFYLFSWNPGSQPVAAGANSLKFQFASSPSSTPNTWNFTGPDGTTNTYYTSQNSTLSTSNNGNQYARYRAYLSTLVSTTTPTLADASFTYSSECTPPGQVLFSGLGSGSSYNLTISKSGYASYSGTVSASTGWKEVEIKMAP